MGSCCSSGQRPDNSSKSAAKSSTKSSSKSSNKSKTKNVTPNTTARPKHEPVPTISASSTPSTTISSSSFADRKRPLRPNNKLINISTSFNPSKITHNNPRLPGVTVPFITGDLDTDVKCLWTTPNNNNNNGNNNAGEVKTNSSDASYDISSSEYNEYWSIITKEILDNKYFPHPLLGLTKDNLNEYQKNLGVPLLPRVWRIEDNRITAKNDINGFTVLQFNMLADGLSGAYYKDPDNNSKAFLNVNPRCLEWNYRGIRLIQDILINSQWNGEPPDIIALEECDQFEWIYNYLKCYGYDGRFIYKSDTPCNAVAKDLKDDKERGTDIDQLCKKFGTNGLNKDEWNMTGDGCALFWKVSKFNCFNEKGIISKSEEVYVTDTNPTTRQRGGKGANKEDWDPIIMSNDIKLWQQRKDKMIIDANESIKRNEDLLQNITDKKKIKKLEKEIKGNKKLLKELEQLDISTIPQGKYSPILSEEKGKLIKQAVTFMAVPLEWKQDPKKKFYAMVTHLKSTKSKEGEKVRVGQLQALFNKGDIYGNKVLDNIKDGFDENLPILFCIDLNGKHTNTYVNDDIEKDEKAREDPNNIDYCHEAYDMITSYEKEGGLGFNSVNCELTGREPQYTTWKQRREGPSKHTIDFVFLKKFENILKPIAHLEMKQPNEDKAKEVELYEKNIKDNNEGLIPDWHYPSDHISLCFRMQWI